MSSQAKTGWVCIATSGPTLDGRTISPESLRQMAEVYDPSFYVANLWPEGVRARPLGHVDVLKVVEEGDRLKLLAVLCPTLELIDLNTNGTHGFCTIEACENFAGTGKWYLAGVTVTDQPCLTGLTKLQFSAKPPSARPLLVPAAVPTPAPTNPAFRASKPEQMFSQLEALSAELTALSAKLDSFTPYHPNQPPVPAADHRNDPTHANYYQIY